MTCMFIAINVIKKFVCYNVIWLGTFSDMCFVYGTLQGDITIKFVTNSLKIKW